MVARAGSLVLVCADGNAAALLGALTDVASRGGDGVALARRIAAVIASDVDAHPTACAAGGPTRDGRYAVVVWGPGLAEVGTAGGDVTASGADAVTVVSRVVAAPTGRVRLVVPGAGEAQPWSRLDSGVVAGAGAICSLGEQPVPAQPPARRPMPPPLREPDPGAPFTSVLLVDAVTGAPPAPEPEVDNRVRVQGILCRNGHFNDPKAPYCAICGISMAQQTAVSVTRPRPPLGLLLLDDGSTFRLDVDYIAGRDPTADPEVRSGAVRPLRITDGTGRISRRHLRIALVGWAVRVLDLGSANGTVVTLPGNGAPHRLAAHGAIAVHPGTRIDVGQRWMRYESNRNP